MSKPIHLYLSRYDEHLQYLRANNQESPSWRELREEELPGFLQVQDSEVHIQENAIVRDWNETGGLEPGSAVRTDVTLANGTRLSMTGYYIRDEQDWFPTENAPIHLDETCGFCDGILKGLGSNSKRKEEYCMLPFLEKKHLFEQVLKRHHDTFYNS
ncbi:hypothetical protein B0H94_11521 [Salsuginibacillus halophilus]|uniref:Uncharacterized protein n=1 Tax=Salsuginibacillus halophilus TaxID=517424 RepID=A0A2P8H858_9BACI|nr:hypothetical protein [Salsuginibacillus halophilus]PSL42417.1 hypothetical protein B0H94_11521 [Salsuginibacillus halophilus]